MTRTITVYTTAYAPWEEHQDEPMQIGTNEETFEVDDLTGAVDELRSRGFTEYSSFPFHPRGWYAADGYIHPHTGEREEHSAHLAGFTDEEQRAIYDALMS